MKKVPDCVPDILRLVLDTAHLVSDDEFIHRKVLGAVMADLAGSRELGNCPVSLCYNCLQVAYKALGVRDPYDKEKARRNKAMLGLEQSFRSYLDIAPDRFKACLDLVLAGILNRDVLGRADAERQILEHLDSPLERDDRSELKRQLARAERIFYLVDAAGEIVLDKLLIEELGRKAEVTAVVARKPVLTVATSEDARAVGLEAAATVADAGAPMLGLVLERAARDFRRSFDAADLVIAKGEHNFQTLAGCKRDIFFLLHARCPAVAARLGVERGGGVVAYHAGQGTSVIEAVADKGTAPGGAA